MSSEPVISVNNVGKAYKIWNDPASRLITPLLETTAGVFPPRLAGDWLRRKAASRCRDFWALQDISFEVGQGEAVGIIGRNGSGKSTLLQIIAGTLQPTAGSVRVNGRVAALLELGSGFNPEFTGRENVYLNGTVLGLSRADMDQRFDAIAAFADIGDFIEQPVKIYSSGMAVRLAFAVCAHVDANILIIDEALGVGDARFQLKCARTIDRFIDEGRTLLFVSHDLNSVKRLCNRAQLLEEGRCLYAGNPNTVVNLYTKLLASDAGAAAIAEDIAQLTTQRPPPRGEPVQPSDGVDRVPPRAAEAPLPVETDALRTRLKELQGKLDDIAAAARMDDRASALIESERAQQHPMGTEYCYGGELGEIVLPSIKGADDGIVKAVFTSGEMVEVSYQARAREYLTDPIYALTIKNAQGQEIYGTNTLFGNQPAPAISPGQEVDVCFLFPLNLIAGEYFISLGWTYFVGTELVVIHRRYDTLKITVLGVDRAFGIAHLFASIAVRPKTTHEQ